MEQSSSVFGNGGAIPEGMICKQLPNLNGLANNTESERIGFLL